MQRQTRSTVGDAGSMDQDATRFILYLNEALDNPDILKKFKKMIDMEQIRSIVSTELQKEVVSLKNDLKEKASEITVLKNRITQLEDTIDNQEQYSRRANLRINGFNEKKEENLEDEVISVLNEKMKISPPVNARDIARIHRVGKLGTTKTRQIIVQFSTYKARSNVYRNKKMLAGTPLSINEDLTRSRSKLYYLARLEKRKGTIKNTWTFDGRIGIQDLQGVVHSISTESEFNRLLGQSNNSSNNGN